MERELLIMRHAKSDWDSAAGSDFERPLNKRGKQAASRMGRWLKQQQSIPDHVVSSPATRAKQTAQRVCAELGFDSDQIRWEKRIYEAGLGELLKVLADCPPAARRVLLIGHNPGLELLVTYLSETTPPAADGNLMPTATIARIEFSRQWAELQDHCGRLLDITRPKQLPPD